MNTKETISKEIVDLYKQGLEIRTALEKNDQTNHFNYDYQEWYTKSLKVVKVLAPDRYPEFKSYYEINPKRKTLGYGTYVIQDYLKGVVPVSHRIQNFNAIYQTAQNLYNQITILNSLSKRINSVLSNIDIELLSDIQDAELRTAKNLSEISLRAAGALTGVVIENHLQKLADKHNIKLRKQNPTISDLNDPLKRAGVFDTPTWRKIAYLTDIRNICSHKKDVEPTKEQIKDIIEGANWLVKNTF